MSTNKIEPYQLAQRQSLPLAGKVRLAEVRIREWYEHHRGMVYVAFSGGKDSTVLLHIVRSMYPEVPAVFCDTGLEFPEVREFVTTIDNVTWLKPKLGFRQVIQEYGYPVVSKKTAQYVREVRQAKNRNTATCRLRLTGVKSNGEQSPMGRIADKWQKLCDAPFSTSDKCCEVTKKQPMDAYVAESGRTALVGTMASDGMARNQTYLQHGCNMFDGKRPRSAPLSVWLEQDVWDYLQTNNVPYSSIYDMGYSRTGCVFCAFGAHIEARPNRFERMKVTHPKLWHYCMDKLGMREVLAYCGIPIEDKQMELGLEVAP